MNLDAVFLAFSFELVQKHSKLADVDIVNQLHNAQLSSPRADEMTQS
jgi:hypothetical protein